MPIVYLSHYDGSLRTPATLNGAEMDGSNDVAGYTRYELRGEMVTLTVHQIGQGEASIAEILGRAGQLRRVGERWPSPLA